MKTYDGSWWWVSEKKKMAIVFIAITLILQLQMKACVCCVETERMCLLELKSYLNSLLLRPEEDNILESWTDDDHTSDCCFWESVNCSDAIGGHIVDLSLRAVMPVPDMLLDPPRSLNLSLLHRFPHLKTFEFSWNWFSHLFDPIHGYKSFQRLKKLRTLDFSGNHLNNSVLPFISAARSLTTLNVDNNKRLIGDFPPDELASMPKLRMVNMQSNRFNSLSPQGLINIKELVVLDLSSNIINDVVESGDGIRIMNLKTLNISYNNFSDTARFKGLRDLVGLKVLIWKDARFNDTKPIEVLKDMTMLEHLELTGNTFNDLDNLGVLLPSSIQVLNLKFNQFSSTSRGFSEICRLKHLRELDLRFNLLKNLPYCLGNLSHLQTLDLSNNELNGYLSSFISSLPPAVEYLSLLDNNFNGSFLFKSLVNQTRLTVFRVSSRVGMIQVQAESSWVPLFQLKILKLQNFILGSIVPGFLVYQHDLCFLDISYSQFTGDFPAWLVENNTELRTVFMNKNSLTRLQLPRVVHGLQVLDISSNRISDSIKEDIGIVLPELTYMNFASNDFHGSIPSSMGEMKSLSIMDVSSNKLTGQLPKTFLSGCYSLNVLKLSNNQLQGKVLLEHANLTSLEWLILSGNNFTGSLGKGLLNSKKISLIDLSDNSFSGSLPLWISGMSSLSYLYLSGNQFDGSFPRQLQNLKGLEVIDISRNSFSDYIPWNIDFPSLIELRLQNNVFMGSIPDTLFKFKELEMLDLRNNNLSGKILNTVVEGSKLLVLLLRNNSLQSHIPEKICRLSKVNLLDLSHNEFEGTIPTCLSKMSFSEGGYNVFEPKYSFVGITYSQQCLYESAISDINDDLSGRGQSYQATTVEFSTKNRYEAYQGDILSNMNGLDLSSNQLSGEIPIDIGDLRNLRSLDLSSNYFTGSIPSSISKLKDLGSLDLSNNKLDGNIPPQLADLSSLGFFNVSYNNLSGEIPSSGHLLTFDAKSYIGNVHLCGIQISKSCGSTRVQESPKQNKDEESDDVIDMVWFYWTSIAVYIFTLVALSAFLWIDSRWSREWFYRVDLLVHHLQHFKGRFICK